jgi:hypothetical protein
LKKKIAVIGKGTAGSQAIAHLLKSFPNEEIVWYSDPKQPAQSVGEGSTLQLSRNLFSNLNFYYKDLKHIDGTFKTGIYKENWGTKNKSFYSSFFPPGISYHFNAVKLQDYVQEFVKDRVEIIEERVDYNAVDADYVFNASGFSKNFDDFYISEYIPVNSAYITQCYWDYPRFDYTLAIASKYGWVFGIPLQNRCSIGYMYNKDINTEEEVAEDVKEVFEKYSLTPSKTISSLSFKNYYRKVNYEKNGSLVHSGNSSFFLEPLEATSIAVMDMIQRSAVDIWSGNRSFEYANAGYLKEMDEIELMIMMHYAAGSSFKTEFWDYAQERGIRKMEKAKHNNRLRSMYSSIKDISSANLATNIRGEFGNWGAPSFLENVHGLGMKPMMDDLFFKQKSMMDGLFLKQ